MVFCALFAETCDLYFLLFFTISPEKIQIHVTIYLIIPISQLNHCYISEIVAPKISHFEFGDEPSNYGDSASVQCLITSGDFPVEFKWLFNGKPLMAFDSISTTKLGKRSSVLTIESVNGNHAGNYTCQVANSADTVNLTATLIVNGNEVQGYLFLFNHIICQHYMISSSTFSFSNSNLYDISSIGLVNNTLEIRMRNCRAL